MDPSKIQNATPRRLAKSRYGNPRSYVVFGKRYYVLASSHGYNQTGIASWYGTKFHGQLTSSREPYNMYAMTAASPTLPIPCFVRVTNLNNGKTAIVKVNDRGPFAPNRIIDLSYAAATKLGYIKKGTALVQVTALNIRTPPSNRFAKSRRSPKIYLQLGAFRIKNNATNIQRQATHISSQSVRIQTTLLGFNPLYRVQVGPIGSVAQSDYLQRFFAQRGFRHAITIIR